MRNLVVLLLLAGLLTALPALAQDQGPHSFGLYFDDAGDGCYMVNEATTQPGYVLEAFMVIAGPNVAVWGLEIGFETTDTTGLVIWLSADFVVNVIDIAPLPNEIIAGFAEPVLPNSCGHAMVGTVTFIVLTLEGFEILAGPTVPASLPGVAAYLDDNNEIIPLNFSTNALGNGLSSSGWLRPGYGLCAVNVDAAVVVESTSWSNLKALYR